MKKLSIFNFKLFAGLAGLLVLGAVGLGLLNSPVLASLPVDCDDNAIIKCGFQDAIGFKNDYNANVTKDLHTLYADSRFNFTADEMPRFTSTAKWGWAESNGKIVLDDGRIVATNSWSLGRQSFNKPTRYPITIGSGHYFWSYLKDSFASGTSKIRTLVMMDKNNKYMEFAVMTACGNPTTGTKPVFQCNMLNKTKVDNDTYKFTTNVTAKQGATVKSLLYNFGDGKTATAAKGSDVVTHTFAPGTWHVTVTVTYNVNGHTQTETVQVKCKTDVTVEEQKQPVFECKSLDGKLIEGQRKYEFTVVSHVENGAKLVSGSFDFGDGTHADDLTNIVKINDTDSKITTQHTYADNLTGEKTITADLKFTVGTDNKNARCQTKINLEELPKPAFECKLLDKQLIGKSADREYKFTATAHVANGAKLTSADFDFDDGFHKNGVTNIVKKDDNTFTISTTHKFAKSLTGELTITANLTFNIGEDQHNQKCTTTLKFSKKTCQELGTCKVLPSTGPTEMLISGLGLSTLVGAGIYYRNSRRGLISDLLNK